MATPARTSILQQMYNDMLEEQRSVKRELHYTNDYRATQRSDDESDDSSCSSSSSGSSSNSSSESSSSDSSSEDSSDSSSEDDDATAGATDLSDYKEYMKLRERERLVTRQIERLQQELHFIRQRKQGYMEQELERLCSDYDRERYQPGDIATEEEDNHDDEQQHSEKKVVNKIFLRKARQLEGGSCFKSVQYYIEPRDEKEKSKRAFLAMSVENGDAPVENTRKRPNLLCQIAAIKL